MQSIFHTVRQFCLFIWGTSLKYKKYQEIKLFSGSDNSRMLFVLLIHVKMPTVVGVFTFMSRKIFILSWVEHENVFITSGPNPDVALSPRC